MKQKRSKKRYFWFWVVAVTLAIAPEMSLADTDVVNATKMADWEQRLLNANRYILLKNADRVGECTLTLKYGFKNELVIQNAPIEKSDCEALMDAKTARYKMNEFRNSVIEAQLDEMTIAYLELVREAYINFFPIENYSKEFTIASQKGGESPIKN